MTVFERRRPPASVVRHALATTRQSVFWLDDITPSPDRAALRGDRDVDLAIVGGGYTGLWTAVLAKERDPGARIIVLEGKRIGWAASGRNGGFCEASLTHGRENGLRRWPDEIDRLDELGMKNLDEIEAAEARYGIDFEFERNGSLTVATEPHQIEWLRNEADDATSRGDTNVAFIDGPTVRAQVHSPTYLAAIVDRHGSAIIHPAKLAAELARIAEASGVEIVEHSPVRRLVSQRASIDLLTAHGTVHAKRVALATNAFPSLLKRNQLMTVPVYDYALMTEPLDADQLESIGWARREGIGDSANHFHYYRRTRDDRILFGGYDAIFHYGRRIRSVYEDRPQTFAALASHFFTTFPQLEGLRFSHKWAGAIDTSTRFCAYFGTARAGRVAYTAGYTGLGVAATRFAAQVMLDQLDRETTERTELRMVQERPIPFPPEPLASIGIQATRWSLARADRNRGRRNIILRTLDAVGMGFDS